MSIFSFLFLLGGVVNVEVGGYMSHIHKIYFDMSSNKKIRSLIPKVASQWFDLPIFSFFCGVVNVEVGGYKSNNIHKIYFNMSSYQKKSGLYSQKWLHNDLICLYFPFFPLCGVVNVEVGGYMSSIHKIYLNMSSYQKNQVSTSKNGFTMF